LENLTIDIIRGIHTNFHESIRSFVAKNDEKTQTARLNNGF